MIIKKLNNFEELTQNFPNKFPNKFSNKLFGGGRILGLDIGTKKIGIAICDDTRTISTPKTILYRQSNQKDFTKLLSIIQENHIVMAVIGYPLNMDGSVNKMTEFVDRFVENFQKFLQENFTKQFPENDFYLLTFDERLSSFEARNFLAKSLSNKKDYDDISASLILENFLNNLHHGQN